MRILIVEDSRTQAEHLSFVLEEMGHTVMAVREGNAALETISKDAPDLVISDINMPGMGGYELCQHIKKSPSTAYLPVILLTSRRDPMDIFRALQCGADTYFTKPWKPNILERRVRALDPKSRIDDDASNESGVVEFEFMNERRKVAVNPARLLRLLMASLEDMLETNQELEQSRAELSEAKKRLEAYTGKLEAKVQVSEELALRITETLDDAIITLDDAGIIRSRNKAAAKIFGLEGDSMGTCIADYLADPHREELAEHLKRGATLSTSQALGPGAREIAGRAQDGRRFPIDVVVTPMNLPSEKLYVLAARDITNRKETEQRLLQSRKMEALGQLTGGVAHDFNNLLTSIIGNLRLTLNALDEANPLRRRCNSALRASERGADLTRQLLAFSRRQVLEEKVINLSENLEGIEDMLHRTLGETIALEVRFDPQLRTARVDPAQLDSAVLNLVVNARDAMPNGGQLTIETANALIGKAQAQQHDVAPGDYVMVAVTDTGEGIPKEHLSRIFEPFFTTKEVGKGTGLGLAQIFGFVNQSRGFVTVHSERGVGTAFKLYFPAYEGVVESASADDADALADFRDCVVLIVEDDPSVLEVASSMLDQFGFTVLTATDGPTALKVFDANPKIDLLFTDMILPNGMTGKDIARACLRARPTLKVLYTSGYTGGSLSHASQLDEVDILLSKPFDEIILAKRLRQALSAA